MPNDAHHLAIALAERAEEVCRYYLPHGRRQGHYWQVGDAQDNPGQSLFVRLRGRAAARGRLANGAIPQRANTAT